MNMNTVFKNILISHCERVCPETSAPINISYECVHECIQYDVVINNNILNLIHKFEGDARYWKTEEFIESLNDAIEEHWSTQMFSYIFDVIEIYVLTYINHYVPEPETARLYWYNAEIQNLFSELVLDSCNLRGWYFSLYGV
jgi:hypothetical protein